MGRCAHYFGFRRDVHGDRWRRAHCEVGLQRLNPDIPRRGNGRDSEAGSDAPENHVLDPRDRHVTLASSALGMNLSREARGSEDPIPMGSKNQGLPDCGRGPHAQRSRTLSHVPIAGGRCGRKYASYKWHGCTLSFRSSSRVARFGNGTSPVAPLRLHDTRCILHPRPCRIPAPIHNGNRTGIPPKGTLPAWPDDSAGIRRFNELVSIFRREKRQ